MNRYIIAIPFLLGLLSPVRSEADDAVLLWNHRLGDEADQQAGGLCVDQQGNVVTTGYFEGSIEIGEELLTSAGSTDVFLVKFDSQGSPIWAKRFGDEDGEDAYAIVVDSDGNTTVAGRFGGEIDFGGGPLISHGDDDVFLVQFDSDGDHLWSQRFGGESGDYAYGLAVDNANNVAIVGGFSGTINFGGDTLHSSSVADLFVAKFNQSGSHICSSNFGNISSPAPASVAMDAEGNVVVTGWFEGNLDFGGETLSSSGVDIYLAKFNTVGDHIWSACYGDAEEQWAQSVCVGEDDCITVAGAFSGDLDFGGDVLSCNGMEDIFLVTFDSSGSHMWSNRYGGSSAANVLEVVTDGNGTLYATGTFLGTIDFGGGTLASEGQSDVFAAKFYSNGVHRWSGAFGDYQIESGRAMGVGDNEEFCIAGYFSGSIDFGFGDLVSPGGRDIFVAKFQGPTVSVLPSSSGSGARFVTVHPNPFNPHTTIDFSVDGQQQVTVAVYNMSGRQVAVLTDQLYTVGRHQADWDGKDSAGRAMSSGTYLVRLQAKDVAESRKIMLVR